MGAIVFVVVAGLFFMTVNVVRTYYFNEWLSPAQAKIWKERTDNDTRGLKIFLDHTVKSEEVEIKKPIDLEECPWPTSDELTEDLSIPQRFVLLQLRKDDDDFHDTAQQIERMLKHPK